MTTYPIADPTLERLRALFDAAMAHPVLRELQSEPTFDDTGVVSRFGYDVDAGTMTFSTTLTAEQEAAWAEVVESVDERIAIRYHGMADDVRAVRQLAADPTQPEALRRLARLVVRTVAS